MKSLIVLLLVILAHYASSVPTSTRTPNLQKIQARILYGRFGSTKLHKLGNTLITFYRNTTEKKFEFESFRMSEFEDTQYLNWRKNGRLTGLHSLNVRDIDRVEIKLPSNPKIEKECEREKELGLDNCWISVYTVTFRSIGYYDVVYFSNTFDSGLKNRIRINETMVLTNPVKWEKRLSD